MKVNDLMDRINPADLEKITIESGRKVKDAWNKIDTSGHNEILVVNQNRQPIKVLRLTDIAVANPEENISDIVPDLEDIKKVNPDTYLDNMTDEDLKKFMVVFIGEQLIGILKPSDIIFKSKI